MNLKRTFAIVVLLLGLLVSTASTALGGGPCTPTPDPTQPNSCTDVVDPGTNI